MFSLQELALVWGIIFLASLLRAFTGFGFALAAVPVFALFMPPSQAVVLAASLAFGIGVTSISTYVRDIPGQSLMPLLLTALPATALGANLLAQLSQEDFMLWIGLGVILACACLSYYRPGPPRQRPVLGVMSGLCSGLMNGAFAVPGPPVIVYALATESRPAAARALLVSFFTLSALMALLSFGWAGMVNLDSLWQFLMAFPAMIIGDRVGLHLFRQYGSALFRRAAIITLLVLGVVTLGKAVL